MAAVIQPRVLKGFRDLLPGEEGARLAALRRLEEVFRLHGFAPIDTPVLEYAEVLLGKGGGETDKQIYRFTDQGGREVAMRFDLTVPFARFMAAHLGDLPIPFKRWHAAKAWRGENTQRGRYREFMQVDFDIVGTEAASADLEILQVIREAIRALDLGGFTIHYSHRGAFNAFLSQAGLAEKAPAVLRVVDKQRKIGTSATRELLAEIAGRESADRVLDFTRAKGDTAATLEGIARESGSDTEGVRRLAELSAALAALGVAESFVLDPSIVRGLDYYTGIVFEAYLQRLPDIGSVCGGGRYDDLASLYTSQRLPGVGASIGIDRILAAQEELGTVAKGAGAPSVLVLQLEERMLAHYHGLARALREAGISAEVYPEKRKLASQFAYAEKRGIALALICGGEELARGTVNLKDLRSRQSFEGLTLQEAIARSATLAR